MKNKEVELDPVVVLILIVVGVLLAALIINFWYIALPIMAVVILLRWMSTWTVDGWAFFALLCGVGIYSLMS